MKIISEPPRGNWREEEFTLGDIHTRVVRDGAHVDVTVYEGAVRSYLHLSEATFHAFAEALLGASKRLRGE